jgi:hypothetical protein
MSSSHGVSKKWATGTDSSFDKHPLNFQFSNLYFVWDQLLSCFKNKRNKTFWSFGPEKCPKKAFLRFHKNIRASLYRKRVNIFRFFLKVHNVLWNCLSVENFMLIGVNWSSRQFFKYGWHNGTHVTVRVICIMSSYNIISFRTVNHSREFRCFPSKYITALGYCNKHRTGLNRCTSRWVNTHIIQMNKFFLFNKIVYYTSKIINSANLIYWTIKSLQKKNKKPLQDHRILDSEQI